MKTPSPYLSECADVTVESLGGLGDGISTLDGKPVFIPKSCAGDRLRVRIVHENHDGFTGFITDIQSPGADRREAPCPYFAECGGCTLQQLTPDAYRVFKTQMLHSALTRAGFAPEGEVIFLPPATRRRAEFKVHRHENGIALAFYAPRSHNAIAVDACLILTPALQSMIAAVNAALSKMEFAQHLYAVSLTSADSGTDMMLTFRDYNAAQMPPLEALCKKLSLARISMRATRDAKPQILCQIAPVEMRLGDYLVPLPPDAFLQATHEGQQLLTNAAIDATKNAASVVDLFSGIGSYSFPLSQYSKVHAVESNADMVSAIRAGTKRHNIHALTAEARDLFKNPLTAQELARFDAAIINPPRAGAKAQTEQLAKSNMGTILMISCNPASFSRDARILKNAGFTLLRTQGIDQFVWSPYLEIVSIFKRL